MTEVDEPTIFGHRFGTVILFSILAILGIIFENKRPHLTLDQECRAE